MHFFCSLIVFLCIIAFHESGHALTAKFFGVKINRIAIGFGKPIFLYVSKNNIEWVLCRWFFLGGYVELLDSRIHRQPILKHSFDQQSTLVQCIILMAGSITNFLLAWLFYTIIFINGYHTQLPFIQNVIPESIMAQAGLKSNDRLITINNQQVNSWTQANMQLIRYLGKKDIIIQISNNNNINTLHVNLQNIKFKNQKFFTVLGIQPQLNKTELIPKQSLYIAIQQSCHSVVQYIIFDLSLLKQIITGVLPLSQLLGPLGIFLFSAAALGQGILTFLAFLAVLNIAIGLTNLLPLPGLDGGLILYALIAKISGKPISIAMEILLKQLAAIIFYLILVQLVIFDIQKLL